MTRTRFVVSFRYSVETQKFSAAKILREINFMHWIVWKNDNFDITMRKECCIVGTYLEASRGFKFGFHVKIWVVEKFVLFHTECVCNTTV